MRYSFTIMMYCGFIYFHDSLDSEMFINLNSWILHLLVTSLVSYGSQNFMIYWYQWFTWFTDTNDLHDLHDLLIPMIYMIYMIYWYQWFTWFTDTNENHENWYSTKKMASIGDLMVANQVYWRHVSGASKRIFATIKSTTDAVKFSNTIQLSPF